MASKYFKSFLYLLGFGGAGFILLEFTKPSEETIKKISSTGGYHSEQEKTKLLFLQKLKASANLEDSKK